ncbi:hypothetical protein CI102_11203 [Trichoderma harzianum]|nr:hypothetical protein CI102_11203 [Trichoderma harzianum]
MDFPSPSMFPPLLPPPPPPESCISLALPFGKTPLSSLHLLLAYSTETPFSLDFLLFCREFTPPPLTSCRFFLLFLCDSYSSRVFRFGSLFSRPGGENQWGSGAILCFFFFPFFFFHPR